MARNPWDYSDILLSNQTGARMGRGIEAAASAISQGIIGYRKEKKIKEAEAAAVEWIKGNADKYGLPINTADEGEIKAAVKAAGGGPQAMGMISGLVRDKQAREMQAAQMAELEAMRSERNLAQQGRLANQGALRVATGGQASDQETAAMIGRGADFQAISGQRRSGDLVRDVSAAGGDLTPDVVDYMKAKAAIDENAQTFTPQVVDLGGGVMGMTTSRKSAVPVKTPAEKAASPTGKLLQDAADLDAAGDPEGAALLREAAKRSAGGKPMSAIEWQMSGNAPEEYQDYYESFYSRTAAPAGAPGKRPDPAQIRAELERRKKQKQTQPQRG